MLRLPPKPPLDHIKRTFTPLLKIPVLESRILERVLELRSELFNFEPSPEPLTNLKEFLRRDKDFIGILLSLTNLSQEKFRRIITARRFAEGDFDTEWDLGKIYREIRSNDGFANEIANMFLEGRNNALVNDILPDFYMDQLSLPENWSKIIRDQTLIGNIIRKKLAGQYADYKGDYVENLLRERVDSLGQTYGVTHAHGQVTAMGLGKEVDIAIPSLDDPYILIMVSYMETTSSNQTSRANEQNHMYSQITFDNRRHGINRVFVNLVDGAGWLARNNDLRKMYSGCDYFLTINTIDQIEPIIFKFLPREFMTQDPPTIIEE